MEPRAHATSSDGAAVTPSSSHPSAFTAATAEPVPVVGGASAGASAGSTPRIGPETVFCDVDLRPLETLPVPTYTAEEHGTWELLLARQRTAVSGRACDAFHSGLARMPFEPHRIPRLVDVQAVIEANTGWRLYRVDGLVHSRDFFKMLADRHFPSTDFIRARKDLDYTPAPDMFHDLFGHCPLLTDPDFTEFFEAFGQVGRNAFERFPEGHHLHEAVARLYWFTVEFGLIQDDHGLRAYGAGSVSSPQELLFCLGDDCRRHAFDPEVVANTPYDIWHLQEDVFVIPSFEALGRDFRLWARDNGLL